MPPLRRCLATRSEADPKDLVRLVAGPDGSVFVDYRAKLGGRGAWVTPRRECVALLEGKPRILNRALRARVNPAGLLEQVRRANLRAVGDALSLAARSGALAGGREPVRSALSAGSALAVLIASDTSERLARDLRSRAKGVLVVDMPWDREALGGRIGKGPRAALVVKRGKTGEKLRQELRRMEDLR